MDENRVFYRLGKIACTLHQIDDRHRFIEIDVKPGMVANSVVSAALFVAGKRPDAVEIGSTLFVDSERFRFDYGKVGTFAMMMSMKEPFKSYLNESETHYARGLYARGWRQRFAQQTRDDAKRKAVHLKWRSTPHPLLGGRTPNQILKRGLGPLEIPKVGFVWVGIDSVAGSRNTLEIQTYPYSSSRNFDNSIRWFLQRGTSLNQALRLNSQHMGELNRQALIGSIEVLLGAIRTMPGKSIPLTLFEKTLVTAGHVDKTLGSIDKIVKQSAVGAELAISNIGIEGKVQRLNKVDPVAIPSL